jgi:hypothetical protein
VRKTNTKPITFNPQPLQIFFKLCIAIPFPDRGVGPTVFHNHAVDYFPPTVDVFIGSSRFYFRDALLRVGCEMTESAYFGRGSFLLVRTTNEPGRSSLDRDRERTALLVAVRERRGSSIGWSRDRCGFRCSQNCASTSST